MKWKCPHCGQHATIQEDDFISVELSTGNEKLDDPVLAHTGNPMRVKTTMIACPNKACGKITVTSVLEEKTQHLDGYERLTHRWSHKRDYSMYPNEETIALPDYVPAAIRQDFEEAQLIKHDSPKACVTLCRRCIQNMIRDFWTISEPSLYKEIDALEKSGKADAAIDALHAIRNMGNFGAHPERDVSLIIDVDPEDAELSIKIVFALVDDWYIDRNRKEERMQKMKSSLEKKTAQKEAGSSHAVTPPTS